MGGGKGGSQTIGYTYYMSLLMGLGRGPISELVEIKVGDKTAWRGPECLQLDGSSFYIDARDLFGGDDKEGGVQGPCRILWGKRDQTLPGPETISGKVLPGLKASIAPNDPMPALRGVTCLWYDGEVTSMNPYPKEWKMRMRRHVHGWHNDQPWYPQTCIIYLSGPEVVTYKQALTAGDAMMALFLAKGGSKKQPIKTTVPGNIKAMNGAHIIYECVTNPEWGRGISPTEIDENSFIYAANQLCAEGFGLCFFWQRQEDVDAFIQIVLDHIGGTLYPDRSTGLLTLRLIRDDYEIEDLPVFEPGKGLLEILVDDSGSQDIAANEIVVKYHDPISNTDGEARAHNAGARIAQGSTNSVTKEFPGLPTKELAARVAVRELIVQSAGLKKYKVRLDRSGWRIAPGMPFVVKAPQRNIGQIVLRAGEIADSSAQAGGYIEVSALEDVFSMPETGMVIPEDSNWTPPTTDPVEPDAQQAFELSYYDLTKHLSQFDVPAIVDSDSYLGLVAAQPVASQLTYDLMVDEGAGFENTGTFSFTANAKLAAPLDYLDTTLTVVDVEHWPEDVIGDSLMIGDERMRIDAYDPLTGEMTVARGVADTLPRQHEAGAIIWLPDDDLSSNRIIYSEGETATAAAATRSTSAVLLEEDWIKQEVTFQSRIGRPYPPADLKVDGESVFATSGDHEAPVFTWATRNRLTQQDQLVGHTEGSVAPEEGTTFEVVIMDLDGNEIATYNVGDATTFTYDATAQEADSAPNTIRVNVVAVRGDYRSLYNYDVPVILKGGYGLGYGLNYGG